MNNNIKSFCASVCKPIEHATPWEKADITKELSDHIEDHAQDLIGFGYPEDEAYKRAISDMGDPDEIGEELNKQYPPFWLIISRIPIFLIIVLLLQFSFVPQRIEQIRSNIIARTDPYSMLSELDRSVYPSSAIFNSSIEACTRTDMQFEGLCNDIIHILGEDKISTVNGVKNNYSYARVIICQYNKNPLGGVSTAFGYKLNYTERNVYSMSQCGNQGAYYYCLVYRIDPDEDFITLKYERDGSQLILTIPLPEEVVEL